MSVNLVQEFADLWQPGAGPPDVFGFLQSHADTAIGDRFVLLLFDQQRRWQTSQPLKVEDYLARLPDLATNPDIKLQLVVGEFRARQSGDTVPDIDEFTARFPEISDELRSKLSEFISGQPQRRHDIDLATQTCLSTAVIGDRLLGRYRLDLILGEGAFGRVWLAYDEELQRQVAIKVPTEERFQRPDDAALYLAEARTVASLDHPHIVPVHDVGRAEDGSVYVVSKFIAGRNLAERIKQDRPTVSVAAGLLAPIAQALHHAHLKHLIHRDVKPANILIDDATGTPYVADFGLAIREEDHLRDGRTAGTPAYMSPEQARGEGHRLDGRSDIFSLGVVLYELLTGKRPFRGSTPNELMHQVISVEPARPRELQPSIPAELERVCLKALSKRASDRYATAAEFADDLLHWQQRPQQATGHLIVVPKGLRSFDADDAEFFLDLLPGPRNREGLPESISFWKSRIEQTDPEKTFSVGLIYGPSGCGKSSIVKAGLLPRLSPDVIALYVEATPEDTETRILRGLRKQLPELSADLGLVEALTVLRRRDGKKVVIVLDQFEQWLHAHRAEQDTELVQALRQCDGGRLQTIVMVRDDFWLAASRFMSNVEVDATPGHNITLVDLFDIEHAEKVLTKFGQAFGKLPAQTNNLSVDQRAFLASVAEGLAQDGRVVSVRLSLFAEMIKGKPWIPGTLEQVGGTQGIGVNFLEETFNSRSAVPKHRLHQQAARDVLKSLLPEVGTDIKGQMRSHSELLEAADYANRPRDFQELLRILDGELRLITPTDPEGFQTDSGSDPSAKYYQLTHDYLVPSLREWLTRKQKETRRGRAELRLAERAALWNAKLENRHLPAWWEYLSIIGLTPRKDWTEPQRKMMRKAGLVHLTRATLTLMLVVMAVMTVVTFRNKAAEQQNATRAQGLVDAIVNANTAQLPDLIKQLGAYAKWSEPLLAEKLAQAPEGSTEKLHLSLTLVGKDDGQVEYLYEQLLRADAARFPVIRDALANHQARITDRLWTVLTSRDQDSSQQRLRAAGALALYDAKNPNGKWIDVAPEVAAQMVAVNPVFVGQWQDALRPVSDRLLLPLAKIFKDPDQSELPRTLATSLLADYAKSDPDALTNLIVEADAKAFASLFSVLAAHGRVAVEKLQAILARKVEPTWQDSPLDPAWKVPEPATRAAIEAAHGMLAERFAFCQDLPWQEFLQVAELLRRSGYRPTRVRPRSNPSVPLVSSVPSPAPHDVRVAAVWTRDGKRWKLQTDLAKDQLPSTDGPAVKDGLVPADMAVLPSADPSAERRFVLLWGEPTTANEQRRILVDVGEPELTSANAALVKQGFIAQTTICVWTDVAGQRRYVGLWSNRGAQSEVRAAYPGFELVDQPQWDVAVAPAAKLADPLDAIRQQLTQMEKRPPAQLDQPQVRLSRAQAQYQLGQLEPALADLDFLMEKNAVSPPVLQYRAWTLARLGKADEARAELAKYLEQEKDPLTKSYVQIVLTAWLGDRDEAVKLLDAAVAAATQNTDGLYNAACAAALASEACEKSDMEHAKRLATRALELLDAAVKHGYDNAQQLRTDVDLAGLHGDLRFTALLEKLEPSPRHAGVWRADVEFESRLLNGWDADRLGAAVARSGDRPQRVRNILEQARELVGQGYRPVAIAIDSESASSLIFHRPLIPDAAKEQLAKEHASAAIALLHLERTTSSAGAPSQVSSLLSSLFTHSPDPRLRSYLLHRLVPYGVDPASILARLQTETDVSRRRALILGIGEFARAKLLSTEQQSATTADLARWYGEDPDAGIHGAAEWSLRQLRGVAEITKVRGAYATGHVVGERQWYLTKTGQQTLVVLRPQEEFLMGSPVAETERTQGPTGENEIRHRRRIGRQFAISAHEVTVAQFQAFRGEHKSDRTKAREEDAPANNIAWYDAVAYCNWLSERESIPPEQWCYDPQQPFAEGMTLYPDYLRRTGYRLPTEAEWEYACRAGATTARYFGETQTLLGEYAWYTKMSGDKWMLPVGSLKPNDSGLFDMQGNVLEWCQDRALLYKQDRVWTADPEQAGMLSNSQIRVLRGGSFNNIASNVRSANRNADRPDLRINILGFRVARTYR